MITSNVILNYKPDSPLNGAFTYLKNKFNVENITKEGIVKVKASSTKSNLDYPIVKRDFAIDYWVSLDKEGGWYEVDFLRNNFFLKSYVIRNYYFDYFENWTVLGSNDGINYDKVDVVTGLQKPSQTHHNLSFKCKYPKTRRIFRIVPKGKRFKGEDNLFVLYRIEFFGRFVVYDSRNTCRQHYRTNYFLYCLLLIYSS